MYVCSLLLFLLFLFSASGKTYVILEMGVLL